MANSLLKPALVAGLCFFFCPAINAENKVTSLLVIGKEYNITFDNGETIRNGKIISITENEYEIQIRGLSEKIKIARSTIVGAEPVRDQPVVVVPTKPVFRQWEIQILADFHFGLAAFAAFDRLFPAVGLGVNADLADPLPYVKINAFHAEATFAQITDGARTIDAINATITPRIAFSRIGVDWYVGAGGGIAALQLKSYTFNKASYTWLGRAEVGGAISFGKKIRFYAGLNGTYWQDSLELLLAVGFSLGAAYVF